MNPTDVMAPFRSDVVANPHMVGVDQEQSQAPAAPGAPKGGGGNWFTNLLPTGGSVAGGLGGAAAGAAAGSFIPVIGTGIGGILGGIIGATAGGAGGKVAENAAEGNRIDEGVASTAVESGIGQAAGGVLGKVFGKGAQLAKGMAEKQVANAATKDAVTARATALKDVAPKAQQNLRANESLDHVTKMGFDATDPSNVIKVAESSNGILNDVLDKALAASGPVDLGHYNDIVKTALAKQGGHLGSFEKVALSRGRFSQANTDAAKLLGELENLGAGIAKPGADPNEIRTLTSKLYGLVKDAKPIKSATTGAIDPVQQAKYNVYKEVRDQIKKDLYERPELTSVLKEQVGNLRAEDVGSQALADHLNEIITKAGQGTTAGANDVLGAISRNINIGDLGKEMASARQIGSSTGAQARALSDAGIKTGEGNGANKAMDVVGMAGSAMGHPMAALGSVASHTVQNPAVLETLSRIGELGKKFAAPAGAAMGAANAQLSSGAQGGTMGDMNMQPQADIMGQANATAPGGGLTQNDLITLALYSPQAFGSLVTPSAINQEKVASANSAEQSLMGLQGASPDMGILSSIGGKLGIGEAGAFQRKAQAAAQQVAQATGTDAGKVEAMLTNYMAGGGNIDEAIQQLLGNLQSVKQNNTNTAYQSLMNYGGPSLMGQVPVAAH